MSSSRCTLVYSEIYSENCGKGEAKGRVDVGIRRRVQGTCFWDTMRNYRAVISDRQVLPSFPSDSIEREFVKGRGCSVEGERSCSRIRGGQLALPRVECSATLPSSQMIAALYEWAKFCSADLATLRHKNSKWDSLNTCLLEIWCNPCFTCTSVHSIYTWSTAKLRHEIRATFVHCNIVQSGPVGSSLYVW